MCIFLKTCLHRVFITLFTSSFFWTIISHSPVVFATPVPAPFSADWLIEEIISRNAGLTAEQLHAKAQEELIFSAGALDDPRVNYAIAPASIGDSIPSNFGNALGVRQVIQLSQTFPWPGKRALLTNQMEATAEVAQFSVEELRLRLVSQGRSLWAQWWYLHEALAVNQDHLRLSAELRIVAETQYANGIGLQQDVLRIQTYEVQLQHQQLILEQEKRRLQSQINHLLNQSPALALGAPIADPEFPEIPDREILQQWLLDSHPELLGLQSKSNVALLNLRLAEKDDYPDLQFNLGYNELWDPSDRRLQVGVSLNIPLDFGNRSARKSAAEYEHHSKQLDIINKRYQLLSQLESQLSRVDQASHSIQLLETELLPKSEQTVNAALANYAGGGGNFYDLIEAQEQLLDMQLLLSNSHSELFIAIAEIDRLSGGRLWPRGMTK